MTDQAPKSAAEEFAALREAVALQRRAIERLLEQRSAAPDYTQTLGKMMRDLKDASKSLTWLVNRPSMQATPEAFDKSDCDGWQPSAKAVSLNHMEATRDIQGYVAKAREGNLQNRLLRQVGLAVASAGVVLGPLIAIGMLHLVPEHGAAWILGLDRWDAGQRLMASANSESWSEIEYAAALLQHNRAVVSACNAEANRTKMSQQCRIVVAPITGTD
ncbi:DUF6118 family protein [Asticcacaulis taihuensis]|uniref:DUF6118 family protein n=1 Tax=Asticcacaulis taihuensis TaxID=260084 RepID=UPI003F7C1147